MLAKKLLSVALLAAASFVWMPRFAMAQAGQAASSQDVQENQKVAQAALQVALLVDHEKVGEVWDGASSITKQLVTRDAFVRQITADRQTVGALVSRSVASVTYRQSDGKQLPPGVYANVAFATRFAHSQQTVRELVSFHLDGDRVWRVSGYTLR
jgi:Protein of unknown function (DUF4019)